MASRPWLETMMYFMPANIPLTPTFENLLDPRLGLNDPPLPLRPHMPFTLSISLTSGKIPLNHCQYLNESHHEQMCSKYVQ